MDATQSETPATALIQDDETGKNYVHRLLMIIASGTVDTENTIAQSGHTSSATHASAPQRQRSDEAALLTLSLVELAGFDA